MRNWVPVREVLGSGLLTLTWVLLFIFCLCLSTGEGRPWQGKPSLPLLNTEFPWLVEVLSLLFIWSLAFLSPAPLLPSLSRGKFPGSAFPLHFCVLFWPVALNSVSSPWPPQPICPSDRSLCPGLVNPPACQWPHLDVLQVPRTSQVQTELMIAPWTCFSSTLASLGYCPTPQLAVLASLISSSIFSRPLSLHTPVPGPLWEFPSSSLQPPQPASHSLPSSDEGTITLLLFFKPSVAHYCF